MKSRPADGLTFRVGSCKETAIRQLAFVSQKYRFACYCNKVKVTGWARLDAETSAEHIACLLMILSNTKTLKDVNEIIVQTSHDTGACYGVTKCAEIVFERGKMVRGEGLQVLEERMDSMDPDKNKIYKFLGIEQADGIKTKGVYEQVKHEVTKRVRMLINTELNDINLVRAINAKVIPVAAYPMNVCNFSNGELKELDQVIKREMRSSNILGKQGSDERLYLKREDGGRGIKSMRDVYQETRLRVACHMACSTNSLIRAAWRREMMKEENAIVMEAVKIMEDVGVRIQFEEGSILIDGEVTEGGWKPVWRSLKEKRKKEWKLEGLKAIKQKSNKAKSTVSKRKNVICG